MRPWLHSYLACLECGGELGCVERLEQRGDELITGSLECGECELSWPVLAGVPLMLGDPGDYLARYREAILSTLVEHDFATRAALELIDACCAGRRAEALRFGDDWTEREVGEVGADLQAESKALALFGQLRELHETQGLEQSMLAMMGEAPVESLIEVGPGAGGLSLALAQRCQEMLLIDLSLRSLLLSKRRCEGASADLACILADACELELASDRVALVVAANVVDLMDEPQRFVASASRWLVRGGELLVSSPEPSLGSDRDDTLREILEAFEFRIEESRDGIPWLREHGSRYAQLYWLQALRASI